jgi:GrpB-like predicted nucleotidyltransferase (UPF0157 family)
MILPFVLIIAKEYEKLKIAMADKYKFDREEYTKAKSSFVKRITEIAKNENLFVPG